VTPTSHGDEGLLAWLAVDEAHAKEIAKVSDAHVAVLRGDVAELKALVARLGVALCDQRDGILGKRPIEWAVARRRDDIATMLWELGTCEPATRICSCCFDGDGVCCCDDPDDSELHEDCGGGCDNVCGLGRRPWWLETPASRTAVLSTSLIAIVAICLSFAFAASALSDMRRDGGNDLPLMIVIAFLAGAVCASVLSTMFLTQRRRMHASVGSVLLSVAMLSVVIAGFTSGQLGAGTRLLRTLNAITTMACVVAMGWITGVSRWWNPLPWPVFQCSTGRCWWILACWLVCIGGFVLSACVICGCWIAYGEDPDPRWITLAEWAFACPLSLTFILHWVWTAAVSGVEIVVAITALFWFASGGIDGVRPVAVVIGCCLPLLALIAVRLASVSRVDLRWVWSHWETPEVRQWREESRKMTIGLLLVVSLVISCVVAGLAWRFNASLNFGGSGWWLAIVVGLSLCIAVALVSRPWLYPSYRSRVPLAIFGSISLVSLATVVCVKAPASSVAARYATTNDLLRDLRPACLVAENATVECTKIASRFTAVHFSGGALTTTVVTWLFMSGMWCFACR
jgi:hypothetical protein